MGPMGLVPLAEGQGHGPYGPIGLWPIGQVAFGHLALGPKSPKGPWAHGHGPEGPWPHWPKGHRPLGQVGPSGQPIGFWARAHLAWRAMGPGPSQEDGSEVLGAEGPQYFGEMFLDRALGLKAQGHVQGHSPWTSLFLAGAKNTARWAGSPLGFYRLRLANHYYFFPFLALNSCQSE